MRKQFPDATHLSCVGFNMTSLTKLGSEYICLVGWFTYHLLPGYLSILVFLIYPLRSLYM